MLRPQGGSTSNGVVMVTFPYMLQQGLDFLVYMFSTVQLSVNISFKPMRPPLILSIATHIYIHTEATGYRTHTHIYALCSIEYSDFHSP